jgi:hypothetical protein
MGAPSDYFDKFSTYFAFGPVQFNVGIIDQLLTLTPNNSTINNDDGTKLAKIIKELRLGNALDLTEAIYDRWKTGRYFPDFNLDADRGYSYLSWSQLNSDETSVDVPDFPNKLSVEDDTSLTVKLRFIK